LTESSETAVCAMHTLHSTNWPKTAHNDWRDVGRTHVAIHFNCHFYYTVFHKKKNRNQIQPILTTINSNYTKIAQSTRELLFIVIMK